MRLHVISIASHAPDWAAAACRDYARRMPRHLAIEFIDLPPPRPRPPDKARRLAAEAERLREAAGKSAVRVALDERGTLWTSRQLASRMEEWMMAGGDAAYLIGGPDGHDPALCRAAGERWSLGALTLPHALVRVIVAEQLYRAWTLLSGHPYHRD